MSAMDTTTEVGEATGAATADVAVAAAEPVAPAGPGPVAEADAAMTGHSYDGIEEYDNPMPGWWKWLFVGMIVFSAGYFSVATLSGGQLSPQAAYDKAQAAEARRMLTTVALKSDSGTLLKLSHESAALKNGAAVFAANCAACHKPDGSGLVGPNLTDDVYIHVRKIEDIPEIVKNGSKNLAMPAWASRLQPNDLVTVSAYVASLRGQNKPGKPPEGQKIPPWGE